MLSTFGSSYFGDQHQLDVGTAAGLGEVTSGSTHTAELYNASDVAVSAPITLPLEDGTFQVTWPGQSALSTAAQLAANPLSVPGHSSVTITVTFLSAARESVQTADLSWAGTKVTLNFDRYLLISDEPRKSVSETIEFKTQVSEAWDGTEQRTRLRAKPRGRTSYEYLNSGVQASRRVSRTLQAYMTGLGSRQVKVALWHRMQKGRVRLQSDLGLTSVYIDRHGPTTWDPDIQAIPALGVLLAIDAAGQIHEIQALSASHSNGTASLYVGTSLPPGLLHEEEVHVIPYSIARLSEKSDFGIFPSDAAEYEAEWTYDTHDYAGNNLDNSTLYSALAPDTYNSRPILREGNYVSGSLAFTSQSGAVRFDKSIGIIDAFHRRESSIISFARRFDYSNDITKVEAFRKFVMWTQGMQRSFYVPSGSADLEPVSVAGQVLKVTGTELGGLVPLLDGYASLEVTLSSGAKQQVMVTSSSMNADGTADLTFTGTISSTPTKVEILYHVRLASDRIRIDFEGVESLECGFRVQSVKQ